MGLWAALALTLLISGVGGQAGSQVNTPDDTSGATLDEATAQRMRQASLMQARRPAPTASIEHRANRGARTAATGRSAARKQRRRGFLSSMTTYFTGSSASDDAGSQGSSQGCVWKSAASGTCPLTGILPGCVATELQVHVKPTPLLVLPRTQDSPSEVDR